jgi:hypothetical protein
MVRDASEQALSEWIGADNMVTICDVSKWAFFQFRIIRTIQNLQSRHIRLN